MIAQATMTSVKPRVVYIGLDEHGQVQHVNVAFETSCGRHRFDETVTWHDQRGVSVRRVDDHWRRMLEALVGKILADAKEAASRED